MLDDQLKQHLVPCLFNAAVRAGAAIMQAYDRQVYQKKEADCRAHETIKNYLGPTRIPILSEEGRELGYEERCNWELFWLVDPLDGTCEFIEGNNEFTVNIALMQQNRPVAAAVYVPWFEKMYLAWLGGGSFLKEEVVPDAESECSYAQIKEGLRRLPLDAARRERPVVAVSRAHQSPETHEYIEVLRANCPELEVLEQGSSYKFCLLGEGAVDLYVRTTPTYEWDTAAGELILSEAGGRTLALLAEMPLQEASAALEYNQESLENPWFVSRAAMSPL